MYYFDHKLSVTFYHRTIAANIRRKLLAIGLPPDRVKAGAWGCFGVVDTAVAGLPGFAEQTCLRGEDTDGCWTDARGWVWAGESGGDTSICSTSASLVVRVDVTWPLRSPGVVVSTIQRVSRSRVSTPRDRDAATSWSRSTHRTHLLHERVKYQYPFHLYSV